MVSIEDSPSRSRQERILIIEDEDLIRLSLRTRLGRQGYLVVEAATGARGLELIDEDPPDLILLDYRLPDMDGLQILARLKEAGSDAVVILMTAYSTVESVVRAMKLGAYTYLNKPFDMDELMVHVEKGLETTALRREVGRFRSRGEEGPAVVAESSSMKAVLETIKKVNRVGSSTVLLRGENGTGKDLLAHFIHSTSTRSDGPFQNITCTALGDHLLETELFGHEKGAFTDAKARKDGLLHLADGGTVFLDEIGDMSVPLQGKLLRFLEERVFRRVGGTQDIRVDVRVIAATNRKLEEAVDAGTFRQDLFYRLSVIPIVVPPLRERVADILPLCRLFIDRFNAEFKRSTAGVADDARAALEAHGWPGNVRELRNVIERAMILGSGETIQLHDLPLEVGRARSSRNALAVGKEFVLPPEGVVLEELERSLVQQALERTRFNQTRAAQLLGMTRDQVRYRVEKFGLQRDPDDVTDG